MERKQYESIKGKSRFDEEITHQRINQANTEIDKTDGLTKNAGLVTYGLFFTGLALIFLSVIGSGRLDWGHIFLEFIRDLGFLLSAAMAGTIVYEKFLRSEMVKHIGKELDRTLESKIPKIDDTAEAVHQLFCETPPQMTGIKLSNPYRRSYERYYDWVNNKKAQVLFFAGRSVLHRIDADIKERNKPSSAEEILLRKLKEGSKIKILFLDPRIDIIERLAKEEGQPLDSMLRDIATSLEICQRLSKLLEKEYKTIPVEAELDIRVYNFIPYFAFHKQDGQVILGFYFVSEGLGFNTPAYEVVDDETRKVFSRHFENILSQAVEGSLVVFSRSRGKPRFDKKLFAELCKHIENQLEKENTDKSLDS